MIFGTRFAGAALALGLGLLAATGCASTATHDSTATPATAPPTDHETAPLFGSGTAASGLPYELQLERVIGTYGSGPGQMAYPEGVAVDDLGRVFISDTGNNRVERFDQGGVFIGEFGGFGFDDAHFDHPRDLFVSGGLNLFVLDGENARVVRYDTDGRLQGVFVDFNASDARSTLGQVRPTGLGGEATGYLYVSDQATDRLIVLNPLAGGWTPLGGFGSQPGRFRHPTGLAVNLRGTVFVGDGGNGRVQALDSFGGFLRAYPLAGPDPAGRVGVAVLPDGEVAACESDSSRLTVFAADGKLLAQLTSRGSKPGMLDTPSAIAADRLGRIYVADTRNHRVQVFRIVARRGDAAH
ncbi:MAG TPA: NHL repeat-containing protein [Candidatus Eisenbacteria bacterium]|nr:NHL repeat-containing protein [Candidatus Eisenbacteria bacterium]